MFSPEAELGLSSSLSFLFLRMTVERIFFTVRFFFGTVMQADAELKSFLFRFFSFGFFGKAFLPSSLFTGEAIALFCAFFGVACGEGIAFFFVFPALPAAHKSIVTGLVFSSLPAAYKSIAIFFLFNPVFTRGERIFEHTYLALHIFTVESGTRGFFAAGKKCHRSSEKKKKVFGCSQRYKFTTGASNINI